MESQVHQNGVGPVAHLSFSGDFGGREKVAASLCRSMNAHGHPCRLYMVVEERAGQSRNDNLRHCLGELGDMALFLKTDKRFSLKLLGQLAEHLSADEVSVLHCHCYKSLSYAVLLRLLGRYTGKVVYTLHGLVLGNGAMASAIKSCQRFCMARADGVIGCSREILDSTMPQPGRVATTSIINAVDMPATEIESLEPNRTKARAALQERYGLKPEEKIIINVGRLCPQKNYPLYLDLIRRNVKGNGGDRNRYLLVGNGELQADLEAMSEDFGIRGHVVFTGFVQDMEELYSGADLLVQTSTWEGTPMCLLEARSHGLPCVVPAVGGNPDVVNDGRDGFLYPVSDLDELAVRVNRYLDDDELRRSHGNAAFKDTDSRFCPEKWVELHMRFYSQLSGDEKGPER